MILAGRKFSRILLPFCLLVPVLFIQGCVINDALQAENSSNLTSSWLRPDDPQEKIGSREHPIVLAKYGGEYRDPKVEKLLAVIVGRLVSVSEDKGRIYKITMLNTPKVNAFALPGGYLYVTRGLLALANDTAELAAVLAHEMAHVSANHAILRGKKQSTTNIGEKVVSEVLGDSIAGRVALAANQLRLADFSRDQELQADAIGIRMLGNAGFDGHGAARFLETMQAFQSLSLKKSNQFSDKSFISSHPTTPQRIALARKHARFFGAPGIGEADRQRYFMGVDGMLFGDSSNEGFVRGNQFSHTGLGIAFNAPALSKIENQSTSVVVNGPGVLATRFDAVVISARQSLTSYFKSGWVKGLDESSIVEAPLNGLPSAVARAKGGDWDFVIRIIQIDRQVYRFITAGPAANAEVEDVSSLIAGSFRRLSESEKALLEPLRIKVVFVGTRDTLGSLAARMKGTKQGLKLFQILNGLAPGEIPQSGTSVKIVSD